MGRVFALAVPFALCFLYDALRVEISDSGELDVDTLNNNGSVMLQKWTKNRKVESSPNWNQLDGKDGLCVIRAACAMVQKKPTALTKAVQDKLHAIVKQGSLDWEDMVYVLKHEGAYPNGFRITDYNSLLHLMISLKNGQCEGCDKDGRYIARFETPKVWHVVCLVKAGKKIWIIDSFLAETLYASDPNKFGYYDQNPEHQFEPTEYYGRLEEIIVDPSTKKPLFIPRRCKWQVFGNP
jgi:hypothetical protein